MQTSRPRITRPRRWLLGGVSLALLILVVVVGYHRRKEPPPVPALAPRAMTIVPGIHLLGGLEPAAAYVVETSEGLVLIDAGLEARKVKREIEALGLDWKRVRAILLTHVHGDHCGGAEELRQATGAKIYAGKGDAAILRAGGPRVAYFSTWYMPVPTPGPTTVDVELADDQAIVVGDVHFKALATPGHTPGSTCYLTNYRGENVMFTGDVLWSLSEQGGDPLGTYSAHLAPRYRGDAAAFLTTLRRLRSMPAPYLVLPGHPRNDPVPQSPVLSQQRWQELLDNGIREMELLLSRYERDGANFLDGNAKQLLPELYYLGDFKGVAVYGFFASSKFLLVNAPGGPGLDTFVSDGLRRLGRKPVPPVAVLLTSGDPDESAGVADLVAKHHLTVVVPPAAREALSKTCPAGTSFLTPEEVAGRRWLSLTALRLHGRGIAPTAYLVSWSDKTVLFTGQIPTEISHDSMKALHRYFSQARGEIADYRDSLRRLREVKPDLWLPAHPIDDQNANLYDTRWQDLLKENDALFR
jgi:hydroxyacylglutathione hydrolase